MNALVKWTEECHRFDRFWLWPGGTIRPVIAGGKGQTTTIIEKEPKSETQLEIERLQLAELRRQNEALEAVFPLQKELLQSQLEITQRLIETPEETPIQQEIREEAEKRTLAFLRGEAPPLAPGQEERISEVFGAARTEGEQDIQRFAEELAASRGFSVTDSPIAQEVLPQQRRLATSLRGGEAQAKLSTGESERIAVENLRQFQENLRLASLQNRSLLTGRSLPLLPFATGAGSRLLGTLEAGRGQTQTTRRPGPGALDIFSAIAGPGAILGAAAISSAKYKRNILPLRRDELEVDGYAEALTKLRKTPIFRYRYRWETDTGPPHIGPILELAPAEITDDGEQVNVLDYLGLQHAGLKALDRKVDRLHATLKRPEVTHAA